MPFHRASALRARLSRLGLFRLRSAALFVTCLVATAFALDFVNHLRPVSGWLVVTLGAIIGWQLLLNLGWLGFGLAASWKLFPARLPLRERVAISVPIGVTGFVVGLYGLGALGLFRPSCAIGLLIAFLAIGTPALNRLRAELSVFRAVPDPSTNASRTLGTLASAAGVLAVGLLYLGIFTPDAVNYDARWMHLGIAADYARTGRLLPFSGDWVRCYPHLASMLHTWSFLVPGLGGPLGRWMMALHTEFALFSWTLLGVSAAINWVIAKPALRGAWAAYFLFPGVFVYDNNMGGAADHVLAFFVVPLFLLAVRLPAQPNARAFLLWGVVAGGALLTKYQAAYVIVPAAVLSAAWFAGGAGSPRARLRVAAKAAGWAIVAFGMVVSPHFLKNWVFHRNPVYPLLQEWFAGSTPTMRDGPTFVKYLLTDWSWKAPSAIGPRFREAFGLMFTFAFRPHYSFYGELPTFGFLFTLSMPLLLFVPGSRRLWSAVFLSLATLFSWAFTYWVDRNLQIALPLFVVTTGAILVRAWEVGPLARVGIAVLVAFQIVWGGDIMFGGSDRVVNSIGIIRGTLDGRAGRRLAGMSGDYLGLDGVLPKDAVVLLHHSHPQLGINREIHLDWTGFQGEIDYRTFANARDLYVRLRALGITHVVHLPGEQAGSFKQEDVLIHSLAISYGGPKSRVGTFEVFELPKVAPPARPPLRVLALGLGDNPDGLYDVTQLGTCRFLPPALRNFAAPRIPVGAGAGDRSALLAQSDAVLLGPGVDAAFAARLAPEFVSAAPYPGLTVYIRSPAR